jgi:hypothetical protein
MTRMTDGRVSGRQGQSWDADTKLTQAAAMGDTNAQCELLQPTFPVARRMRHDS